MDSKTVVKERASAPVTDATRILDRKLSKREGDLGDAVSRNSVRFTKTQIYQLGPQDEEIFPALAQVRRHGKEPRCEGRNSQALFQEIQTMSQDHGRLVWLRLSFPQLDHHDLLWSEGRKAVVARSKRVVYSFLSVYGKQVKRLVMVIQRDKVGRIHGHAITHLDGMSSRLQALLEAASTGTGGGTMLSAELHGVILGESDTDRESVSKYMSKFHDERINLPSDDPLHLQLLDEVAQRMICGEDDAKVKLIWRLPYNWRPGMKPPT